MPRCCCLLLCRDIFVSVYLDRLLEVDCFNYRHESILYFYITWNDTSAAEKVTNNTLAVLRGESESLCACYAPQQQPWQSQIEEQALVAVS